MSSLPNDPRVDNLANRKKEDIENEITKCKDDLINSNTISFLNSFLIIRNEVLPQIKKACQKSTVCTRLEIPDSFPILPSYSNVKQLQSLKNLPQQMDAAIQARHFAEAQDLVSDFKKLSPDRYPYLTKIYDELIDVIRKQEDMLRRNLFNIGSETEDNLSCYTLLQIINDTDNPKLRSDICNLIKLQMQRDTDSLKGSKTFKEHLTTFLRSCNRIKKAEVVFSADNLWREIGSLYHPLFQKIGFKKAVFDQEEKNQLTGKTRDTLAVSYSCWIIEFTKKILALRPLRESDFILLHDYLKLFILDSDDGRQLMEAIPHIIAKAAHDFPQRGDCLAAYFLYQIGVPQDKPLIKVQNKHDLLLIKALEKNLISFLARNSPNFDLTFMKKKHKGPLLIRSVRLAMRNWVVEELRGRGCGKLTITELESKKIEFGAQLIYAYQLQKFVENPRLNSVMPLEEFTLELKEFDVFNVAAPNIVECDKPEALTSQEIYDQSLVRATDGLDNQKDILERILGVLKQTK